MIKEYTKEELQEYSKEELIDGLIDAIGIIKKLDQLLLEKKDKIIYLKDRLKYQTRCKNYYNAVTDYYSKDKIKRFPQPEDFGLKSDEDGIMHLIEGSRD